MGCFDGGHDAGTVGRLTEPMGMSSQCLDLVGTHRIPQLMAIPTPSFSSSRILSFQMMAQGRKASIKSQAEEYANQDVCQLNGQDTLPEYLGRTH